MTRTTGSFHTLGTIWRWNFTNHIRQLEFKLLIFDFLNVINILVDFSNIRKIPVVDCRNLACKSTWRLTTNNVGSKCANHCRLHDDMWMSGMELLPYQSMSTPSSIFFNQVYIMIDNKLDQNAVWFIASIAVISVNILTASIVIIQFSRHYKDRRPIQNIIFLLEGFLLLCVGIFLNYKVIQYVEKNKNKYENFIIVPQAIQKINIVFLLYIIYIAFKKMFG